MTDSISFLPPSVNKSFIAFSESALSTQNRNNLVSSFLYEEKPDKAVNRLDFFPVRPHTHVFNAGSSTQVHEHDQMAALESIFEQSISSRLIRHRWSY